jgi:hypothetical protein
MVQLLFGPVAGLVSQNWVCRTRPPGDSKQHVFSVTVVFMQERGRSLGHMNASYCVEVGAGADELLLEELEMTVVEDDVVGSAAMDVGESVLVVIVVVGNVGVLSVVIVAVELGMTVVRTDVVGSAVMNVEVLSVVIVGVELEMTVVKADVVESAVMGVEDAVLIVITDERSGVVDEGNVEVLSVVILEVETSLVVAKLDVSILTPAVDVLEGIDVTAELEEADVLDGVVVGTITDVALEVVLVLEDIVDVVETALVVVDNTAELVEADVLDGVVLEEEGEVVLEEEKEDEEDEEDEDEDEDEEEDEVLVELLFPFGPVLLLIVKVGTDVDVLETVYVVPPTTTLEQSQYTECEMSVRKLA